MRSEKTRPQSVRLSNSYGAALPEFSIVIILLLTFAVLMVEVGRPAINHIKWVRLAGATAFAGADTPQSAGLAKMDAVSNLFYSISSQQQVAAGAWNAPPTYYSVASGSGMPLVKVNAHANFNPIFGSGLSLPTLGAGSSLVVPYMLVGPSLANGNAFANPPCTYNCYGTCGPSFGCPGSPVVSVDYGTPQKFWDSSVGSSDNYRNPYNNNGDDIIPMPFPDTQGGGSLPAIPKGKN